MKLINSGAGVSSGSYAADLYARCDGTGTPSVTKSSINVTGITDTSTGRYSITHTALPSANGSVGGAAAAASILGNDLGTTQTTTVTPVFVLNTAGAYTDQIFSMFVIGA